MPVMLPERREWRQRCFQKLYDKIRGTRKNADFKNCAAGGVALRCNTKTQRIKYPLSAQAKCLCSDYLGCSRRR